MFPFANNQACIDILTCFRGCFCEGSPDKTFTLVYCDQRKVLENDGLVPSLVDSMSMWCRRVIPALVKGKVGSVFGIVAPISDDSPQMISESDSISTVPRQARARVGCFAGMFSSRKPLFEGAFHLGFSQCTEFHGQLFQLPNAPYCVVSEGVC